MLKSLPYPPIRKCGNEREEGCMGVEGRMDELEQEMQSVVQRIVRSLRDAGWQDVEWDAESEAITLYDPESMHTIALLLDWA